jgi:uncharacterized membrane protein YdjX (TVP38/TMEM64 family)
MSPPPRGSARVPDLRRWYSLRARRAPLAARETLGPPTLTVAEPARPRRGLRWLLLLVGLAAAAAVIIIAEREFLHPIALWFSELGAAAPAAFITVYVLLTVALVPNSFLTIASGALFGLFWGTVYSFTASVIGAGAAFLTSRYLVRDRMARRVVADPRFQRIDRAICRDGLRVMLLIRLSPVFPFSLLNYALGLSRVRLRDYMLGSISMLPGTALYVYPGMVAGQVIALGAGRTQNRDAGYYLTLAAGLAVTLLAIVLLTRTARRALREETDPAGVPG